MDLVIKVSISAYILQWLFNEEYVQVNARNLGLSFIQLP